MLKAKGPLGTDEQKCPLNLAGTVQYQEKKEASTEFMTISRPQRSRRKPNQREVVDVRRERNQMGYP